MKRFIVRQNCEYSQVIEAETEQDAIAKASADENFIANADAAWSRLEAEEE